MDYGDELDDGHHRDVPKSIPQIDGGGYDDDDGDWRTPKKKKTPKKGTPKKGGGDKGFVPKTPSRRDRGRGVATATPSRSTRGSTSQAVEAPVLTISFTGRPLTTVKDIYTSPPAAAFTTLRREGSILFKARLSSLNDASQHVASPVDPSLDPPQLTGPAQDLFTAGVSKESPVDSGIDVLTPSTEVESSSIENQQSTQQVEDMAPLREVSQAERDRLRQRAQESEAVSGKPSKSQLHQSLLSEAMIRGVRYYIILTLAGSLKKVIQDYYEIQVQVYGYVSETETRDVLVNKAHELSQSLSQLAQNASKETVQNTFVPPEVVDYIDDGRNPDIYKRDLVEVVQRGNAVLNGKMNAFSSFSQIFANDLRKMSPEMAAAVDEIMGRKGDGAKEEAKQENQENGDNHKA
jgi:mediator of RNA polymerase II transcription subunit 10